jgi:serine/threonine protein kinase
MNQGSPSSRRRSASSLRPKSRQSESTPGTTRVRVVGGRYRIVKRAGAGMTALVYFAEDIQTRTRVVVKQLTEEAAGDAALSTRFMHEVHAISGISHPNVVRILDYGAPAYEQPFLVMEALPGETLSQLLRREDNLDPKLALFLARQAAAGLLAVHRSGAVHRDIKPDNLFLVGPLGRPTGLKIIDFGMAKLPDNRHAVGDGRFVVGTLPYMPPEQVLADPVDARADVYSLGIVMFRLLTGHLPFEVEAGLDMLGHQLLSALPPPNWLNDSVDPRLESIIVRATRKHPLNRYQTMAAFLRDLESLDEPSPSDSRSDELTVVPDQYVPTSARAQEIAAGLTLRFRPTPMPPRPDPEENPESTKPFNLARRR